MDIYLNDNHDFALDGQDLRITTTQEDVKQRLAIRLQFLLEEWFLDNTKGLPYVQEFFKGQSDINNIYEKIRLEIINTVGVISLDELKLTPDDSNKSLRVDFTVRDQFSSTPASIEVSI